MISASFPRVQVDMGEGLSEFSLPEGTSCTSIKGVRTAQRDVLSIASLYQP